MARRRRNSGAGRKYAPAIKEQMNVVRLMDDDVITMSDGWQKSQYVTYSGNSIFAMLVNAGLATYVAPKNAEEIPTGEPYIVVARDVRFKVLSAIAQPGKRIELGGTGESFINNSTDKPMKVRIPKNDLVDAQWFTISAGQHLISSQLGGSIGNKNYNYLPFGGGLTGKDNTYECITVGYCFI